MFAAGGLWVSLNDHGHDDGCSGLGGVVRTMDLLDLSMRVADAAKVGGKFSARNAAAYNYLGR